MLRSISIENYALLDQVEIEFDAGFNIITGETGAGKSILLGAIGLVMGQRADTKVLHDQDKKCIIEACFDSYPKSIDKVLDNHDLDISDELIIRREINSNGRSRAFVNDTPAKLEVLSLLSSLLLDLNQQFQILDIQDKTFQLKMVDSMAGNQKAVATYSALYNSYQQSMNQLKRIEQRSAAEIKEIDFIKFQHQELAALNIAPNEIEDLEQEVQILEKTEHLTQLIEETDYRADGSDNSLREVIQDLTGKWSEYEGLNNATDQIIELLSGLQDKVAELNTATRTLADVLDSDPSRVSELRSRLDSLSAQQRKHGVNSTSGLLDILSDFSTRIDDSDHSDEQLTALRTALAKTEKELTQQAEALSKSRKSVFASIEKKVNAKLKTLAMEAAQIKITNQRTTTCGTHGLDDISIEFKANKGSDFQSIKSVASGGETSRLMLALKATVADKMSLPSMIFDEIDTGVSGEVSKKMGQILNELSRKHQIICITHSPQITARGGRHIYVYKEEHKKRTITKAKLLDKEERIIEIAKMLSGNPPSTYALDNAKDLLKETVS